MNGPEHDDDGQLALLGAEALPRPARSGDGDAVQLPVAEVVVDSPLAHLDRRFEYAVPAAMAETAAVGARVKVRFAGKDLDGFVVARTATAEHIGALTPIRRVVSPEPVLTPHLLAVCRQVADHYAGTLSDVLRLAIPPRHARAEQAGLAAPQGDAAAAGGGRPVRDHPAPVAGDGWDHYPAGRALIRRIASGEAPRAAWTAVPDGGSDSGWPDQLAVAAAAAVASGRGAVLVVPDHRDVARLEAAVSARLPAEQADTVVRLTADLGPERRYRAWLAALRGQARVVVGTRAAAFAPVRDLGLLAWWDDGDDLLGEQRAPYPHVREILRIRAEESAAALLVGGFGRTTQVQQWVYDGSLVPVEPSRAVVRERSPRILVAGEGHEGARDPAAASARIPSLAWRTAKRALESGPVLVQVPRRGYLAGLSCQDCRTPVRCPACSGPVQVAGPQAEPACAWCARPVPVAACPTCGSTARRSTVQGDRRTAEELGRAFPGVPVRTSGSGQVLERVGPDPALVVATPGAEPVADGGYAAALLLDGWALLDRAGLEAPLEACRRWLAAASLTRPGPQGAVVLCGVPAHAAVPAVEAVVRWGPVALAETERGQRAALGLPPVGRLAALTGDVGAVTEALGRLSLPAGSTVLGPEERGADRPARVLLLVPPGEGGRLCRELVSLRAWRSLHKAPGELLVRLDAPD